MDQDERKQYSMEQHHPFLHPTPNGEGLDFDEASRAKHELQMEIAYAVDTKGPTKILFPTVKRIPPLGTKIRDLLVTAYSRPECLKETLSNTSRRDCVARVYLREWSMLGVMVAARGPKLSVHDFPLFLERVDELLLDVNDISARMGATLAFLHWGIGCSGTDVRFALGGVARTPLSTSISQSILRIRIDSVLNDGHSDDNDDHGHLPAPNDRLPSTDASSIQLYADSFSRLKPRWGLKTLPSIKDAVKAYLDNPPFPRPDSKAYLTGDEDEDLWEIFAKKYVDTCAKLGHALAGMDFIDAIEHELVPARFAHGMQSFQSAEREIYLARKHHEGDFWSSAVIFDEVEDGHEDETAHACRFPHYICTKRKKPSVLSLLPQ